MDRNVQRGWKMIWAGLAMMALLCGAAQGALINLQAYVTYALLNNDGTMPLSDGSIVQIVGSSNNIADPMPMIGGSNVTGFVSGDDVILATITIQSGMLGSNGTFFAGDVYFQSDEIKYMYIRFYDSAGPLTGLVYWGESPITNVQHDQFGVVEVDFVGNYATTNLNNFVAIPEPGTLNFMLMWGSMVLAMRASMKRDRKKKQEVPKGMIAPSDPVETYERF